MNILYTEVVSDGFDFWRCLGAFGLSMIVGFIVFWSEFDTDPPFTFFMILIIAIIGMSAVSSIGKFAPWSPRNEHNRYTVTIDDDVNFKEFTSKYKVIEQKDELYIVEEIENADN